MALQLWEDFFQRVPDGLTHDGDLLLSCVKSWVALRGSQSQSAAGGHPGLYKGAVDAEMHQEMPSCF